MDRLAIYRPLLTELIVLRPYWGYKQGVPTGLPNKEANDLMNQILNMEL